MKSYLYAIALFAIFGAWSTARGATKGDPLTPPEAKNIFTKPVLTNEEIRTLSEAELLFDFQGKGSSLAYDAGVASRAFEMMRPLAEGKVVLSANSGGSIMAIYFACHGISEETMKRAATILVEGTPRIRESVEKLRTSVENPATKVSAFVNGIIPAIGIENLDPYIESALGIDSITDLQKATCRPKVPFVIVAANYEILDNKSPSFKISFEWTDLLDPNVMKKPLKVTSLDEKVFDPTNFSVSWKPHTYDFFTSQVKTPAGLAEFQKGHPGLVLRDTPYIGKSCTYFASPEMFQLLKSIPSEERLCDVRLTDDPKSMALAIRASAAEPTYFKPVPEYNPSAIVTGDGAPGLAEGENRSYWGGFVMPMVAQDIRRVLPHLYVMGTGWNRLDDAPISILKALVLLDSNVVSKLSEYWADLAVVPTREIRDAINNRKLSRSAEFQEGRNRAQFCFDKERTNNRCLPDTVAVPAFRVPSPGALNFEEFAGKWLRRSRKMTNFLVTVPQTAEKITIKD